MPSFSEVGAEVTRPARATMTIVERNLIFGVVELDAESRAVAEVDGLSSAKMKELSLWISD